MVIYCSWDFKSASIFEEEFLLFSKSYQTFISFTASNYIYISNASAVYQKHRQTKKINGFRQGITLKKRLFSVMTGNVIFVFAVQKPAKHCFLIKKFCFIRDNFDYLKKKYVFIILCTFNCQWNAKNILPILCYYLYFGNPGWNMNTILNVNMNFSISAGYTASRIV